MDALFHCKSSLSAKVKTVGKIGAAALAAFFLVVGTGCSNGIAVSDSGSDSMGLPPLIKSFSVKRQRQFVLPINAKFYIPTPVWTFQKEKVNPLEISSLLAQAIGSRFPNVVTSGAVQDMSEAIRQARSKSANFVLYVRPNDWHQRAEDNPSAPKVAQVSCAPATDWSNAPAADDLAMQEDRCQKTHNVNLDNARADLTVWLIDAPTGQVMDLINIESQSGLLPLSSGTSAALLRGPFTEVARRLAPSSL